MAYKPEDQWNEPEDMARIVAISGLPPAYIQTERLEPVNYNQLWESQLQKINIDNWVQIIPGEQSPDPGYAIHLFIRPQMSFGTGHHATTRMMMQLMRDAVWSDTKVLDMGSGTGILGILAIRLGAAHLTGIDIEDWCTENAGENAIRNGVSTHCTWLTGTAEIIPAQPVFDRILANINRNILLADVGAYCAALKPGGYLFISGFHTSDLPVLEEAFHHQGLRRIQTLSESPWAAALFELNR